MAFRPMIRECVRPGFCGPACLEFVGERFYISADQAILAKLLETTEDNGTTHQKMIAGVQLMGLEVIEKVGVSMLELVAIKELGYEIIVNWMDGADSKDDGHYSVLREILFPWKDGGTIVLDDPGWGEIRVMKVNVFEKQWYDYEGERKVERWALAIRRPRS